MNTIDTQSPSEMLMNALGEIDNAKHALIIIAHDEGKISWHCTSSLASVKLGLVDFVRECMVDDIHAINRAEACDENRK